MTEIGEAVDKIMRESFPVVVNTEFTANMESLLDGVEDGKVEWKSIIRNFYPDLEELIKSAEKELEKIQIADEETDVVCENCGRHMVIKYGPHGKFLACPGFPECKNTKPYLEKIGVSCPKCGKEVVIRKTKKGRKFFGCEDYPDCDFVSWQRPVAKKCPKCNNYMVIRGKKIVCSDASCGYSEEYKPNEE
jgi:DNA topoisomerase-1